MAPNEALAMSQTRTVKVAFLYAPPWKIARANEAGYGLEGPPPEYKQGDLDADFYQIPYGILSLAAQTIEAGYPTRVVNMSAFHWNDVVETVRALDADVFGLSCWTANRRGVDYVTRLIKELHPHATVVVGGPHATPLPEALLRHYRGVDLVCVGESEETLLEILERRGAGQSLQGIAGSFYREGDDVLDGGERKNIEHMDSLAAPHDYFGTHILMTSRGCPWSCTFCGAESSWGRGFRAFSNDYVLRSIRRALSRLPVRMIQIKDDTFTTQKKRVLELCRRIREEGLQFFWSCDTRVDLLNEELVREMRLAGCERLSLGVETGSQTILDAIEKKITVDEIIGSTELAKKHGIKVRYYMMLGNRGETRETFEETLRFLERAKPHEYIFSCLSIYPGTKDYTLASQSWLTPEHYFNEPFQELKTPLDAPEELTAHLNAWFEKNHGLRRTPPEGSSHYLEILARLGDYHAAHMDLGAAYYREGALDLAEKHVARARELGYPCPGLVLNHRAAIAAKRGRYEETIALMSEASKTDAQHFVLRENAERIRQWLANDGLLHRIPLELAVRHDFQLFEQTVQPMLPGPLPASFASFEAGDVFRMAEEPIRTPEHEGSRKGLQPELRRKGQLPVI